MARARTLVMAAAGVVAASFPAAAVAEPSWDFVTVSDMMIASTIVGAADGMRSASPLPDDLSSRVEAVRKHGPDMSGGWTGPANDALIEVRNAAYESAVAGEWSEDALDGYLQVMEIGYEARLDAAFSAFPYGSSVTRLEDAVAAVEALGMGFYGSGAPYAVEAMAKIVVLENAVQTFLNEIPDTRDDVLDEGSFASVEDTGYREFLAWSSEIAEVSSPPRSGDASPSPI